jgi:hypothetical protein
MFPIALNYSFHRPHCRCGAGQVETLTPNKTMDRTCAAAASTVVNKAGPAVGGLFAALIIVGALGFVYYKYRMKQIAMKAFDFFTLLEQLQATGEVDGDGSKVPREIRRDCVTMTDKIGMVLIVILNKNPWPECFPFCSKSWSIPHA